MRHLLALLKFRDLGIKKLKKKKMCLVALNLDVDVRRVGGHGAGHDT